MTRILISNIFQLDYPYKSGSSGLTALRAFRVLRVLKTMSIVPGLRSIVQALLHSIQALKDAVVLTLF